MSILFNLHVTIKRKKIERLVHILCDHMWHIYNYLYKANSTDPESVHIKGALAMTENWDRVSENVFKYKPTAATMEIRREAKLESVTKKIVQMEIPTVANTKSQLVIRLLTDFANDKIDDYYKTHRINGRDGW